MKVCRYLGSTFGKARGVGFVRSYSEAHVLWVESDKKASRYIALKKVDKGLALPALNLFIQECLLF